MNFQLHERINNEIILIIATEDYILTDIREFFYYDGFFLLLKWVRLKKLQI